MRLFWRPHQSSLETQVIPVPGCRCQSKADCLYKKYPEIKHPSHCIFQHNVGFFIFRKTFYTTQTGLGDKEMFTNGFPNIYFIHLLLIFTKFSETDRLHYKYRMSSLFWLLFYFSILYNTRWADIVILTNMKPSDLSYCETQTQLEIIIFSSAASLCQLEKQWWQRGVIPTERLIFITCRHSVWAVSFTSNYICKLLLREEGRRELNWWRTCQKKNEWSTSWEVIGMTILSWLEIIWEIIHNYSIILFLVGDTVISGTGEASLYDRAMSIESPWKLDRLVDGIGICWGDKIQLSSGSFSLLFCWLDSKESWPTTSIRMLFWIWSPGSEGDGKQAMSVS